MTLLFTQILIDKDEAFVKPPHQLNFVLQLLVSLCSVSSLIIRNLQRYLLKASCLSIGEYSKKIIESTVLTSRQLTAYAGYSTWSIT